MKNKSFLSWIINPFTHIAGGKALIIGLFIQLLTVFFGNMAGMHFDGALDLHIGAKLTLLQDFCLWLISTGSLILVLYASGLILTRRFRFIDLAGTVLLARTLFILSMVAILLVEIPPAETIITNPSVMLTIPILVLTAFSIVIMIWYIVLLYNAYKISVGLKTDKAVISFVIALAVAEIMSKVLIINLIK